MKRRALPSGIQRLSDGVFRVWANCGPQGRDGRTSKRFPAGTSLAVMLTWQEDQRDTLDGSAPAPAAAGSLEADAKTVRLVKPAGRKRYEFDYLIAAWLTEPEIRGRGRFGFDTVDVRTVLQRWADQGDSPSGRNNRLGALRFVYKQLDGDKPNPTDKIKYAKPRPPEVRSMPIWFADRVIAEMPDRGSGPRHGKRGTDNLTKIRLRVIIETGQPHIALERMEPTDVGWTTKTLDLHAREKGGGVKPRTIPISDRAIAALRDFDRCQLWGKTWSRPSMRACFHRALARTAIALAAEAARTGDSSQLEELKAARLPSNLRPYDLRHSFLSDVLEHGDITAAADLAHHSGDLAIIQRYTQRAVATKSAAAIAAINAARPAPPALRLVTK